MTLFKYSSFYLFFRENSNKTVNKNFVASLCFDGSISMLPFCSLFWKGNWLKSSASSHCTSTPVINDHHRPEQSERVFKTNGCVGQSQSKDFCLWNQINCSATNPLLLIIIIIITAISIFCDNEVQKIRLGILKIGNTLSRTGRFVLI